MTTKGRSIREELERTHKVEQSGNVFQAARAYVDLHLTFPGHSLTAKKIRQLAKQLGTPKRLEQTSVNKLVEMARSGHYDKALEFGTTLLLGSPREAFFHNVIGIALRESGDVEGAVHAFRNAVFLNPKFPEASGNLAACSLDLGKPSEGLAIAERALKDAPNADTLYNIAGLCLMALGRFSDAIQSFDKAITLNPRYAKYYNNKGVAYKELENFGEAIRTYRVGLERDPENVDLLMNLAFAYTFINAESEAISIFQKVIRLRPSSSEAQLRLGITLAHTGRTDDSLNHLREAVRISPEKHEAFHMIASQKKFTKGDPEIDLMEERLIVAHAQDDDPGVIYLSFALGKAYEDIGEYEKAFEHWQRGNALKARALNYDPKEEETIFADVREIFPNREGLLPKIDLAETREPIFIVGMMRSGTTLAEQILSAHSRLTGVGEIPFIDNKLRRTKAGLWAEFFAHTPGFADEYFASQPAEIKPGNRVVDKMPINFLWIGHILTAFPHAKIIHMNREPRDVALSIFKNLFVGGGNPYAYGLESIGEYYVQYLELMNHWKTVFPEQILDVHYEDLVQNLEEQARRMVAFCGLPWETEVLGYRDNLGTVKTASLAQVRQGVYGTSVGKWKRFEGELEPFSKILRARGLLNAEH